MGHEGRNIEVEGSSIAGSSNDGGSSHSRDSGSNNRGSSNLGGQMGSTSSSHSRLISRSNSSVGVGNQRLNVQVEGSSITSSSHNGGSSHRGSHNRGSVDLATTGSKVVSRDHSSIRVANQVGVQIERSSISVSNNRGSS